MEGEAGKNPSGFFDGQRSASSLHLPEVIMDSLSLSDPLVCYPCGPSIPDLHGQRVVNTIKTEKKLCCVDPRCDLLDLGFDDLDPAGGVDGLDCLEEIPGDLTGYDPVEERVQVPCC